MDAIQASFGKTTSETTFHVRVKDHPNENKTVNKSNLASPNPMASHSCAYYMQKQQAGSPSVTVYAVQCGECFKWRVIPTEEEFEEIRSRFIEDPFSCNKKANVSCEDAADIEYDSTRIWAIDKPNLPKTPPGFKRELVLRRDFSKMDAYYVTPLGTRVGAPSRIASFLEANPQCEGVSISDFSFTPPKLMDDTLPENVERKGSSSSNKRIKTLRNEDGDV